VRDKTEGRLSPVQDFGRHATPRKLQEVKWIALSTTDAIRDSNVFDKTPWD